MSEDPKTALNKVSNALDGVLKPLVLPDPSITIKLDERTKENEGQSNNSTGYIASQ